MDWATKFARFGLVVSEVTGEDVEEEVELPEEDFDQNETVI